MKLLMVDNIEIVQQTCNTIKWPVMRVFLHLFAQFKWMETFHL
jgi:hypothetical protein